MRFGIGMNTDHTLEEVGQQFSVTRERIRQIEAKALRKLKHPSRSRKLRSFLDSCEQFQEKWEPDEIAAALSLCLSIGPESGSFRVRCSSVLARFTWLPAISSAAEQQSP